jgi:hypothetical protein
LLQRTAALRRRHQRRRTRVWTGRMVITVAAMWLFLIVVTFAQSS